MKKLLCFLFGLFVMLSGYAQKVNFEFSDGIEEGILKTKMEQQMSSLLSAINEANAVNADVNFSSIDVLETKNLLKNSTKTSFFIKNIVFFACFSALNLMNRVNI